MRPEMSITEIYGEMFQGGQFPAESQLIYDRIRKLDQARENPKRIELNPEEQAHIELNPEEQAYVDFAEKHLPAYLEKNCKRYYRKFFHDAFISALTEAQKNNKQNSSSSIETVALSTNAALSAGFIGVGIEERVDPAKLSELSKALGSVAVGWDALGICFTMLALINHLKNKLHLTASATTISLAIGLTQTILSTLSLSNVHVISTATGLATVSAFSNFAFGASMAILCGIEISHHRGCQKRINTLEQQLEELKRDKKKLTKDLETYRGDNKTTHPLIESEIIRRENKITLIENKIALTKEYINFERQRAASHKRNAIVYGSASVLLIGISFVALFATLPTGILPIVMATILLGVIAYGFGTRNKKPTVNLPKFTETKEEKLLKTPSLFFKDTKKHDSSELKRKIDTTDSGANIKTSSTTSVASHLSQI
jgi:predicted membrane protein